MDEIIKHLHCLFKLTNNPKYVVYIADYYTNSDQMKINMDAVDLYRRFCDTMELYNKQFNNVLVEKKVKDLLNEKTLIFTKYKNKKERLSVIIPTMWKCPESYFKHNVSEMLSSDCVKEIIIIDNDPSKKFNLPLDPRIKMINNKINIGVNPAWNQGVLNSSAEYYLLLNDDCLISESVLEATVAVMDSDEEVGIVNYWTKKEPLNQYITRRKPTFDIKYLNHIGPNPNGWFIGGRTKEYFPIPEELVYFYGDNLIHDKCKESGKRVVKIISDYISHDVSTTVKSLDLYRQGLLSKEGEIYKKIRG